MKYLYLICRILLGAMFVFSGVMGFVHMDPSKMPALPPITADWHHAMMATGWMKCISAFQLLGGLLVLAGAVPMGLCILCPILVNILLYHLLLPGGMDKGAIVPGLVCTVLAAALIYRYRGSFAGIFELRAKPTA